MLIYNEIFYYLLIFNFILNIILIYFLIYKIQSNYENFNYSKENNIEFYNNCKSIKKDYKNNKFAIIRNPNMYTCGLFCYYNIYLSCVESLLIKGYIPIVDLNSFPNILNDFLTNSSKTNPWEYFFEQPYCYSLNEVLKRAEKIIYYKCTKVSKEPLFVDYFNKSLSIIFWSNIATNYIPIKKKLIKESNIIKDRLFRKSNNVLGVFIRGTDYISVKPKLHPKVPSTEQIIKDIKLMNKKFNYDWIFIITEDKNIRKNFINEFGYKLKYLLPKRELEYNYKTKKLLFNYNNILGSKENLKNYILNMIILSKCLDIITCLTNGSMFALIINKGLFRYNHIYYLGLYN